MRIGLDGGGKPSQRVGLDGACEPTVTTPVTVYPRVALAARLLEEYDDEGNPVYGWETVVEDAATVFDTRRVEADDRSGETIVEARVSVVYHGSRVPHETWVLKVDGVVWKISQISQVGSVVNIVAWQVDSGDQWL